MARAAGDKINWSMKRKKLITFGVLLFALICYAVWIFLAGPILIVRQIHNHNANVIKLYCLSGVSLNRDAWMIGGVFHCAVASGNQDIVKMMIACGADVNRIDGYGTTPLDVATAAGDVPMMQLLVENGSDISKRDRNGNTALDVATHEKLDEPRKYLEQAAQKIKK
jgi:ankyrin repeat protein